jgi:hypothetical protein
MQTIEQHHAETVLEAHILALNVLADLLQKETDPTEQRRIAAIILRTKPTRPKPADQPPAPPKPRKAKPHPQPLLEDNLDSDLDEDDDLHAGLKPFTHHDLQTLRAIMAATTPRPHEPAPAADHAGGVHPSP